MKINLFKFCLQFRSNLTNFALSSNIPVNTTTGTISTNMVTSFIVNTVSATSLYAIQPKISGATFYINKSQK